MSKAFLRNFFFLSIGCHLLACSASRNQAPSAIGLVPLSNYETVNDDITEDTTYHVFQNDAGLAAVVRATGTDAKKPSFNGQIAVALFTKAPSLLQFERAGFIGDQIHVYIRSCTPSSQPGCNTNKVFLATLPKVGNARSVQFFVNSEAKAIVDL
jgi:hypothetical protein